MTRRRLLTALALFGAALFILAACAELGPQPHYGGGAPIYYSNIAGLALREGPTTSATQISTLQFNNEVQLLETKDGWGRVLDVRRNIEGWAAMRYLQSTKAQWPRQIIHQDRPVPKQAVLPSPGSPPQPSEAPVSKTAGATPPPPIYYSNIVGLPLRNEPTTSAREISTLQFNDEVQLLETKDGWGRVLDFSRNIEGWVAMRYLQPSKAQWPRQITQQERPAPIRPTPQPPRNSPQPSEAPVSKTAEPPIYYANITGLPLRKGPNTSDPEVSTLQFNDEVQLLETKDGWGRVLDVRRNIEGWAAMRYLQSTKAQWPRQFWSVR